MSDIKKIKWSSKYSVDIEEVDAYQKKMFELFNELIEIKENKLDTKECTNKISEINDYAKIFFATEEKILRRKGYPDFQNHTKAHRQFIKDSISLRREIADDIENLSYEVIAELRDWLLNHMLTLDQLFVPYIRINNYIETAK
ncbi:MAG: bacteriohemerythrin [Desulfobacula sp.]|nr:bacteriohemerythrin [Desulfobacula sp.]